MYVLSYGTTGGQQRNANSNSNPNSDAYTQTLLCSKSATFASAIGCAFASGTFTIFNESSSLVTINTSSSALQ